jgi:serine/threonine protein kinase
LYSLAATLYHLLAGTVPPDAVARVSATTDGEDDPLRPAYHFNHLVPPQLSEVLSRAMSMNRSQRFASAAEMRAALSHAASQPAGSGAEVSTVIISETLVDPPSAEIETGQEKGPRWDERTFFHEAGRHLDDRELDSLRRLYAYSMEHARVTWGRGAQNGSFNVKFDNVSNKSIYSVFSDGTLHQAGRPVRRAARAQARNRGGLRRAFIVEAARDRSGQ